MPHDEVKLAATVGKVSRDGSISLTLQGALGEALRRHARLGGRERPSASEKDDRVPRHHRIMHDVESMAYSIQAVRRRS